jgi:uncharacterized protein (DUF4213/DUF364 family)
MSSLLEKLLADLPDAPLRAILVGAHWTVVCSRGCGLASTLTGDKPHGHESVADVGDLLHKTAGELAQYALSENPLEASLGVAAINSLLEVDDRPAVEANAYEALAREGKGKNIALVGHFPFIPKLQQAAANLWVIEQSPSPGEHPAEAAGDFIPRADLVAITGTALINHTLESLLALCSPEAQVMILGPSTPLSPLLFDYGADLISGTQVVDEAAVLRTVSQGAIFRQVQGVRLLTFRRPDTSGLSKPD